MRKYSEKVHASVHTHNLISALFPETEPSICALQ